jgi:hypothetical protein
MILNSEISKLINEEMAGIDDTLRNFRQHPRISILRLI